MPAWWAVTAPSPPEGTLGSTDATHTGELILNPTFKPSAGAVRVFAPTREAAVVKAIIGTIEVEVGGQRVDHEFGPGTVSDMGTSTFLPTGRKAFTLTVNGSTVTIGLEDLEGVDGVTPDWDCDDRTWELGVTPADPPVVFTDKYDWIGPGGQALVTVTVTQPDENTYLWDYDLDNQTFETADPNDDPSGIAGFTIGVGDADNVTGSGGSYGPLTGVGDGTGPHGGDELSWGFGGGSGGGSGDTVEPGESAEFWYTTPPTEVETTEGDLTSSSQASFVPGPAAAQAAAAAAKLSTTTTLAKPSVTWPAGNVAPTGMSLSATVKGAAGQGAPAGSVKFYDGSTVIATIPLVSGANDTSTASAPNLPGPTAGSHPVKVEYVPGSNGKYTASTSDVSEVEYLVLSPNAAPVVGASPNPTGGNLKWPNFGTPVQQAPHSAFTAAAYFDGYQQEGKLVTITHQGQSRTDARRTLLQFKTASWFDPAKSYVLQGVVGGPNDASLLRHENLHLTISEYVAQHAELNIDANGSGNHTSSTKDAAKAADIAALGEMQGKIAAYQIKWKAVDEIVRLEYDNQTGHGGSAVPQANWDANWTTLVNGIMKNQGWPK